jgi:hypothetical protein
MNPVKITKATTTGASTEIFVPDRFTVPTNISAYLVVNSGAGNWSLEQTPDDVTGSSTFMAASATWIRAELSGVTATTSTMITRCPMGMRLFMDSGTGSATLTLIQVGPGR